MRYIRFKDYLKDYLDIYNISYKDFANRMDISQKHLIDILNGNVELTASLIEKLSILTGYEKEIIYKIEENCKFEMIIDKYLKENNLTESKFLQKFNYRYLVNNEFLEFIDVSDKAQIIKDILKFLRVTSPEKVNELETEAFYKSKNDKPELLLLWLEKCYRETLNQTVGVYKKENINELVNYINECAKKNIFNEKKLINRFNELGIFLVIQSDIPGSKIRGAFKVHRNKPAIYLTYKHKRIGDIYFALLHELAHCKTDFNAAKANSLMSFENDKIETKADYQAFNWMVNDEYYKTVCLGKEYDITKEKKYPTAFIVYRLAKDSKIKYDSEVYQKYNKVIEK